MTSAFECVLLLVLLLDALLLLTFKLKRADKCSDMVQPHRHVFDSSSGFQYLDDLIAIKCSHPGCDEWLTLGSK